MKQVTFDAIKLAINPPLPKEEINEHLAFIATIALFKLAELNDNEYMQGFLYSASCAFKKGEKFGDLSIFFEDSGYVP